MEARKKSQQAQKRNYQDEVEEFRRSVFFGLLEVKSGEKCNALSCSFHSYEAGHTCTVFFFGRGEGLCTFNGQCHEFKLEIRYVCIILYIDGAAYTCMHCG